MSQPPQDDPDAFSSPQQDGADDLPLASPVCQQPSSPTSSSSAPACHTLPSDTHDAVSPYTVDRVFPIRSVVRVDPSSTPKPTVQPDYFHPHSQANDARIPSEGRRLSHASTASISSQTSQRGQGHRLSTSALQNPDATHQGHTAPAEMPSQPESSQDAPPQLSSQLLHDFASLKSLGSLQDDTPSPSMGAEHPVACGHRSVKSVASSLEMGGLVTHRFQHVTTEEGHMVITGRGGETLQRCEDEPIHIPGAIQGFGLLIALQDDSHGNGGLVVRVVSENCKAILGRSPAELFALESFTDILSEEQSDNLLDHIDFIKDEDADVVGNGPEVFTMSIKVAGYARTRKLWCAIHINQANPKLIICEFELEDDPQFPLVPLNDHTPELPEDTLSSNPSAEELQESTEIRSRPLRVLRSARKRKGEAAAMEVFNIMSQVQEQLAAAINLESFLKVLVGVVKELTGFHRVMVYQFDRSFNGRVVTELVDPRATKDLYKGLNFPASDIPKQARELYKVNKVRMLYDRDQETARLVCRTAEDLTQPLDLTHSYLRAMSPIHLKYLANMAVRSSMSVSINAFDDLWGLVACHSYGPRGMRVSFPIRKMCRMVGDSASRNIERLSYASRLQARKLINTSPTQHNPTGYIIASSDDLLKLFNADFGVLSIRDETKILGQLTNAQEALALLEYIRLRKVQSVMSSTDVNRDFPDLRYQPGFHVVGGILVVPLSAGGGDFIVFFRKGQVTQVKWAGNPYEKFVKQGTEGYLEPRKSFKTWSETVVGKCRDWTEEEIETASVLCLVYGKFIEVWRQKEAALESSQLTRLLLANSAHEVRTPLNAIINYLEIALEGSLDSETRENLARSHSASKSLIYVINDLLDLTKTEEGGLLVKGESFNLKSTIKEATNMFINDAKRKNIAYEVIEHAGLPRTCIGDQRRVRQAISNITANAIQNTTRGSVTVEVYAATRTGKDHVDVEVAISDTGVGMNAKKLDQLFYDLEQVQSEPASSMEEALLPDAKRVTAKRGKSALGLGLAVVARIIKNMNGQLRIRSEQGKGTRFVIQFPFDLPDSEGEETAAQPGSPDGSLTPQLDRLTIGSHEGERTLIAPTLSRNHSDADDHPGRAVARRGSADSQTSKTSLRSFASGSSKRSDVDRLIEAMQEATMGDRSSGRGDAKTKAHSCRSALSNRLGVDASSSETRSERVEMAETRLEGQRSSAHAERLPGTPTISTPGSPLRAARIPAAAGVPLRPDPPMGSILGEVGDEPRRETVEAEKLSAEHMHVLVAEDDPVNSRIVKKRLERLGHEVRLTGNGEECASAFGDQPRDFDVVLMDMQMPIVDGLTSTKMIRSFEKTHSNIHSRRAGLCGRIPIIAVSASLLEQNRWQYIDAGFDAWILKPISFDRLNHLMAAIVDAKARTACLYHKGAWEQGGWFHAGQKSSAEASTKPSGGAACSDTPPVVQGSRLEDDGTRHASERGEKQEKVADNEAQSNEDQGNDSAARADGEEQGPR